MRDDTDLLDFDPDKIGTWLKFPAYEGEPFRFGFNPHARGYRTAAALRRAVLLAALSALAIVSASLWACGRLAAWQAVLGIAGPLLAVAAVEWSWRRARFCPSCGVRTKSPREASALAWCPACHNLGDPAGISVEPVGQFELVRVEYLGHVDPVVLFLVFVVLKGIRGHAQEIRFEPDEHGYPIRFATQDKVYELEPAPSWPGWLATPVAQAVKVIAGLDWETCDRRQDGHIHLRCGGHDIPTDVVVEPAEFGPKVTLRFLFEYWITPCQCESCASARRGQESLGAELES